MKVIFEMPIYEYRCKTCGHVFEKMMRWSDADSNPVCPNCQGQNTQKKMTSFASFGGGASFGSGTSYGSGGSGSSSSCGSSGGFS